VHDRLIPTFVQITKGKLECCPNSPLRTRKILLGKAFLRVSQYALW
jgi:hypothetical protein